MANRSLPVQLKFENYATTDGTAVVIDRNVQTRFARAFFALGLCFVFAGIGIFVPLFHFVIVPTLVITGITLFAIRIREHATLLEVHGYCPRCKEQKVFPASGRFHAHRSVRCNQCAERMELIEPSTPSA